MQRRKFLKQSSLSAAAFIYGSTTKLFSAVSASHPNILIITCDQLPPSAMSCTGNTELKTPAMDSIAANGIRFDSAYGAYPLCAPARACMLTGRLPHEYNAKCNTGKIPTSWPIFGKLLKDAGYDTGFVGKWHQCINSDEVARHGFTWTKSLGLNGIDNNTAKAAVEFLEMNHTNPFCLFANFVNPHNICEWARGQSLPDGSIGTAPSPENCPPLPDNFEPPPNEPSIIRPFQLTLPRVYPTVDWDNGKWRQYRWAMGRLVEKVDALIGQVLDALKKSGKEENTVVIFMGDHGDGYATHRWNQKNILYEESAGVPFIISQKGVTPGGKVTKEPIQTGLDLMPTICSYAGLKLPPLQRGKNLRPLAEGSVEKLDREFIVNETQLCNEALYGRMVRTRKYKYIVYSEGDHREQLFDREKDPGEMNSLAEDSDYAGVLNLHRSYLAQWCEATSDNFAGLIKPTEVGARDASKATAGYQSEITVTRRTVSIRLPSNGTYKVSIYNINGKEIFSQSSSSQYLSFNNLNAGKYVCRITGGKPGHSHSQHIVIP